MVDQQVEFMQQLEIRVEQNLLIAIRVFQNTNEQQLLQPPAAGGWSIAQCLWHLNSYSRFYLPLMEQQLGNPTAGSASFKSGWLGAYFVKIMNPKTGTQKYKAFKDHVPPESIDAYAEVAAFIQMQEMLLGYIKQARTVNLNMRLPVSISKLIKLKLGDVFQFMIAHDERHVQQALRNLPDYKPEK
jgi:hypothetical protein